MVYGSRRYTLAVQGRRFLMTDRPSAATFSAVACPDGETVRIAAAGEIDMATTPQLKAVLLAAIEQPIPPRDVRIDLAEVTFMDASGIGVLISGREAARCRGLGFTVQNPQGVVLRVLEILGLTEKLTLAPARR
jgi:anti-sigma B factor antagonist